METTGRYSPEQPQRSLGSEIARNPVVQTLVVMGVVSLATWTGKQAGDISTFVLHAPVTDPWWSALVSIYAHDSPGHLASNAVVLIIAGGLISLSTSMLRFHAFFILSGVLAGISFVMVTSYLGDPVGVLGASGATFALAGYVATGNVATSTLLGRTSSTVVAMLAVVIALVMTVYWSAPGSAYFVHFVGAALGLLAGHFNLLRATGAGGR